MEKSIEERFENLYNILNSHDFLTNRGLGNEVGYYIFDYNPKYELRVREHIRYLENQSLFEVDGYTLKVFNLYEIMMNYIDKKGYLDKISQMEEKHSINFVTSKINRLLKMEEFDDSKMYFTQYISNHVDDNTVVILTGIGEIYPLIRAHSVLNKMHLVESKRPVIMMYPGTYDRRRLNILDTNREENYYRAFRIY